ncbi:MULTISPECIES: hypothetical protein [Chryseobacterium]|uniref:Right handed beta helix region n=1 Tax=Chryseobacterium taihuense TaxID=1141221 RepID=A0A4U8WDT4_9FLAO|nr:MULTISPECIES: hypothetical protein [Chryseobacterium]QQV03611.1 hypothetical protein I6I61_04530 [Chryseobacterium sp. FDAARGOS 1104]VFB03055.1 Uncharacterised protein [Chryseobacterium taihuense]
MKKNLLKIILLSLVISTSIHSCSKDEEILPSIVPVGIALNPDNFKGEVKNGETVTLDALINYKLTGSVVIKNGGILVIPAGTRITATEGASSYILVEQGGKIYLNGTSGSPVLFTSEDPDSENWGGIVICGKAPVNNGTSGISEIGNATYGGTDSGDNSGSLNYVRIEYAGAEIGSGKRFNGLSLFGVGNETRIENIATVNNAEDGIEIYGGTVNVSNIVSIANTNHSISYRDGWVGTATNIYTKRKTDGTGNLGLKGINSELNDNALPKSNPIIRNATFIGGNVGDSIAIKLHKGAGASLDNIVLSNWKTGIMIEGDAAVKYFNGKKKISNILFDNVSTEASLKSSGGTAVTIADSTYIKKPDATGAGNGISTPVWAIGWSGLQQ